MASKVSGRTGSLVDEKKGASTGGFVGEIEATFKAVNFDNTVSRILDFLNYQLDARKDKDGAKYMSNLVETLYETKYKLKT